MAYDGKLLAQARAAFEDDKARRREEFRRQREALWARLPRLKEIDVRLRRTAPQLIALALRRGEDPAAQIERLKTENLALQQERAAILTAAGCEPDALTEKPFCAACGDTGYLPDGAMCTCLQAYYVRAQNRELSKLLNIGAQSFDSFDMEYYSKAVWPEYGMSPYDNMDLIRETCWRYARSFGKGSGSLLLTGTPGLGKTFLSACIAREVSRQGFSVVYDTAGHIVAQFETDKFRRGGEEEMEEAAADVRRYLNCDLLIVDDLGTELATPFVQDALYQLINGRIVTERATIVNSNLDEAAIRKRYSPQIASRLCGEYRMLRFFGEDIRKLRQRRSR